MLFLRNTKKKSYPIESFFELYTDAQSAMEHYVKVRKMFRGVAILLQLCFFLELLVGVAGVWVGYVAAVFIGLMLLVIVNTVLQLNNTIAELEESLTGLAFCTIPC